MEGKQVSMRLIGLLVAVVIGGVGSLALMNFVPTPVAIGGSVFVGVIIGLFIASRLG